MDICEPSRPGPGANPSNPGRRTPLQQLLGLGRMAAFQKPNGQVCGIVVGHFLQRLVAQPFARLCVYPPGSLCTLSFWFVHACADAVAHALFIAAELDPDATVLSVDGIRVFDTVSAARPCCTDCASCALGAHDLPSKRFTSFALRPFESESKTTDSAVWILNNIYLPAAGRIPRNCMSCPNCCWLSSLPAK